ncbi:hypothetical protein QA640_24095 [Bradyrhizobium sp. CB82]|uniref:hypothetical protein n=1 Tax=Bradyrhizobium sp. CB82 TaxID=3039159 RepID=UPI0024B22D77|nr:hypothetical protein [Bradyrhizobium sp. CB82]WFU37558.1 hypothetical protein QA640_24095 [Bradyrhizobium sp. CB82]
MALILSLLVLSAGMGAATASLRFRAQALVPVSLAIALAAALVLHSDGFGFLAGTSLIVACLVVAQLAYVLSIFVVYRGEEEIDDAAPKNPQQERVAPTEPRRWHRAIQ